MRRGCIARSWHKAGIHATRINLGAKACLQGSDRWEWISHWLPTVGEQWAARVSRFADKQTRLQECTRLLCREPGYEEPWVIVTDLPPREAPDLEQLPPTHVARQTAGSGTKGPRGRELSCLTRGRLCVLAAVWRGEAWPQAALWPEEWPAQFPPARPVSAARQHKQRKQRERQRVRRRNYRAARRVGKGKRKKAA